MGMKIELVEEKQGTTTKLTIIICCSGQDNAQITNFKIADLALVQFKFTQHANYGWELQNMIKVQNKAQNSTIKVKVFCEKLNYSSERIYSLSDADNGCWNDFGKISSILDLDNMYVFLLSVTLSAIKIESMVYEKLYNDTDFTDFHLSTAEGSVAVHKAVLAANSDVFKTMLSQEWKETTDGRVQIEGVTLQTLQQLKQYMYLSTLPEDGLVPLLSIALCYLMENLKTECISKLTQNIKPEDLYNVLEYSIENKVPELTFALMKVPGRIIGKAEQISAEKNVNRDAKEE